MIKKHIVLLFIFVRMTCWGQTDSSGWIRAFPITEYIVKLNDTISVVQLYLPEGPALKEKKAGLLRGVYANDHADTIIIGTGRCHLIKGDYYYFSINNSKSKKSPKQNDLLYTVVQKPAVYIDQLLRLAAHFIELQNVYEEPFYDRVKIFQQWKQDDAEKITDSIVQDIKFTGEYFTKNNPSTNRRIESGIFKDQSVFSVMIQCKKEYIQDFFDYMLARPRLYAGHKWKISEIFATWLSSGSPGVLR